MVLLEIDTARFAIFEFESDAPWSINVDGIARRIEPAQGMKVEARDVHFLGPDGNVQTVESCKNAFMHFRVDFRTPALRPQFRKGLASKGSDHD
jgi:hypothetical protein